MRVPGEQSRLSGVLCPLPGGHPGELRGPVQREALQHLQGVRHLRGAGSLRQQGEGRPVAVGGSGGPCVGTARKWPLWGELGWAFHHGICHRFMAICTQLGWCSLIPCVWGYWGSRLALGTEGTHPMLPSPPLCPGRAGMSLPAGAVGRLLGIGAHPCCMTPPRASLSS